MRRILQFMEVHAPTRRTRVGMERLATSSRGSPAGTVAVFVAAASLLFSVPDAVAGTSLRFHGNGSGDIDRVKIRVDDPTTVAPGPPVDVGADDFTMEFWLKGAAANNTSAAVACGADDSWILGNIVLDRDRYNQDRSFGVSVAGGRIVFGVSGDAGGDRTICGTSPTLDDRWHHVAVQRRRADGWMCLFVDGVLEAQADGPDGDVSYPDDGVPGNYCGGPCDDSDPFLVIGAEKHDAGPSYPSFSGWIDEVRISTTLRYASGFTRPNQRFTTDGDTAALYHFDEGSGTTAADTSGAEGGPSDGELRVGGSPSGPEWSAEEPPFGGYMTLSLTPVASGLARITSITSDGSDRLFVTLQSGQIRIVDGGTLLPTPFLDISDLVSCCSERGLLSLAFDPDYAGNGRFYVNYTDADGDSVVARYTEWFTPNLADPNSAVTILTVDQPYANHNGGPLAFGPDGYLYVALGDGGSGGDPGNRAQNLGELLGKILRIDVGGAFSYSVPPSNPFVGVAAAEGEIWARGLRNPWKMAFDHRTGDLFTADVGQGIWEEVSFQPAASSGGENYGWRLKEGDHCYNPASGCDPGGLTDPVIEYPHTQGNCSITGGTRYRGALSPRLDGVYLFGDFCSGRIWGASQRGDGTWRTQELLDTSMMIASFGEDADGEVYVASYSDTNGTLYRLAATPVPDCTSTDVGDFDAPATAHFGVPYLVSWSASGPAGTFELQEAASPTFATAASTLVSGVSAEIAHFGESTATFYTRVRAVDSCGGTTYYGPWTSTASTVLSSAPECIVEVSNRSFAAPETVISCGTLTVGPTVDVQAPGVAFRAAYRVALQNGFSVAAGAALTVGVDPSLATL